ncbi:MAG: hypothetical protein H6709_17825 [Kofleriaceae bacterium]|nr:hypothetical protein [Kofleriaceae bacterium]MCB9573944.1 hypothetical protein [Kofleriaceae bacterium]
MHPQRLVGHGLAIGLTVAALFASWFAAAAPGTTVELGLRELAMCRGGRCVHVAALGGTFAQLGRILFVLGWAVVAVHLAAVATTMLDVRRGPLVGWIAVSTSAL